MDYRKIIHIVIIVFMVFTISLHIYLNSAAPEKMAMIVLLFLSMDLFLIKTIEKSRKEFDKNLLLLNSHKYAVDSSNLVSKTDTKGVITYVNDEFCRISGYSKDELHGKPHNIIRHPDMPKETFKELWKTIRAKKIWHGQVKNLKKNGDVYIVDTTIVPILDAEKNIEEFIAIRHDITDLLKQKKELKEIKTDSLTGLKNKNGLKNDIERYNKNTMAILHIDNYNEIKDFYGVETGDSMIKTISGRLLEFFNQSGCELYKLSSKQFAILIKDSEVKEEFTADVRKFIKELTKHPIISMDYEIYVDVTAGIAHSGNSEDLIKNADLALQEAKKGKTELYLFDENISIIKEHEKNILWSSKLKKAILENRLAAFYQPIVNNKTKKYEKYESLIRMIDKDGKIISPFFFLDMAKRSRLYPHITKTVIKECMEAFKNSDKEFSINITAEDTENENTVNYFETTLIDSGMADRCVIEITESEEIKDYARVIDFIKKFKKLGCKIAIDDFGSGYSNFSYLADLGADYVKIDGTLIKNIDKDKTSELIAKTIVSFAKNMGMKTIAEFVSTKEIYEKVTELGIDYSQGYYFSEPAREPAQEAKETL